MKSAVTRQSLRLMFAAVLALAVGCASSSSKGSIENSFGGWSAQVGSDYESSATITSIEVETPETQSVVDVEVHGRFGFETSGSDFGSVSLILYSEGGPSPTASVLRPDPRGGLTLGEPGLPPEQGESSHTWWFPQVNGNGRIYELHVLGEAADGDGDNRAEVEGTGGSIEVRVHPPRPTPTRQSPREGKS